MPLLTTLTKTFKIMLGGWKYMMEQDFGSKTRVQRKLYFEASYRFKRILRNMGNGTCLLPSKSNEFRLRLHELKFRLIKMMICF